MGSELVVYLYKKVRNIEAVQILLYSLLNSIVWQTPGLDRYLFVLTQGFISCLDSIQPVHQSVHRIFRVTRVLRKHLTLFFHCLILHLRHQANQASNIVTFLNYFLMGRTHHIFSYCCLVIVTCGVIL